MGKWSRVMSTPTYKRLDYTGRQVNGWTVLGLAEYIGAPIYKQIWKCKCECGEEVEVLSQNITSGRSKGCPACVGTRYSKNKNPNWRGQGEIPGTYLYHIQMNAQSREIGVVVTAEEIDELWKHSNGRCALSGMPIELGSTASLDRKDSTQPYTLDNLQWVHKIVNHMKNKYPESVFIDVCHRVAEHTKRWD